MKRSAKIMFISALMAGAAHAAAQEKGDPANGAKVWADVCARCHNVRLPSNLSEGGWKIAMRHMRVRAGLTGKETRDTLAFILQSKQ